MAVRMGSSRDYRDSVSMAAIEGHNISTPMSFKFSRPLVAQNTSWTFRSGPRPSDSDSVLYPQVYLYHSHIR